MKEFYYSDITVYGFHGCHAATRDSLLHDLSPFRPSQNEYDWLGDGIYFWEGDPYRAREWATASFGNDGAVVGAKIQLGRCFDLSNTQARLLLRDCYEEYELATTTAGISIPTNRNPNKYAGNTSDLLLRYLDRAVFQYAFNGPLKQIFPVDEFDSVRASFQEGYALYPNSGLRERDHIHLCIRNPACVQSLFEPEF